MLNGSSNVRRESFSALEVASSAAGWGILERQTHESSPCALCSEKHLLKRALIGPIQALYFESRS